VGSQCVVHVFCLEDLDPWWLVALPGLMRVK